MPSGSGKHQVEEHERGPLGADDPRESFRVAPDHGGVARVRQHRPHVAKCLRVVVDHEDPRLRGPASGRTRAGAGPGPLGPGPSGDRDGECEPGPEPRAPALGPDPAPVCLDEPLRDREPEARAAREAVPLAKEVRDPLRGDAPPLVRHREHQVVALPAPLDPDRRGGIRVPGRVRQEVAEHLYDALRVGHRAGEVRREIDREGVPAPAGQEGGPGLVDQRGDARGLGGGQSAFPP